MGRTETEHVIASVWCEVLGVSRVGAVENFFDVGGTSQAAVAVGQRLGHRLGRPLPEVTLFQYPTVRALATYLDGGGARRPARHRPRPGRRALPVRHEEE